MSHEDVSLTSVNVIAHAAAAKKSTPSTKERNPSEQNPKQTDYVQRISAVLPVAGFAGSVWPPR
jgi:hypothetical protein